MEYLEQLATEWYEYRGYFVRKDLWVGLEANGTYECELDVVAFHPTKHHVVHIEPSYDLQDWAQKEQHFQAKFDAGRKYLHRMFGVEPRLHIDQIALIASDAGLQSDMSAAPHVGTDQPRHGRAGTGVHHHTVAGGRILMLSDFLGEILQTLSSFDPSESVVPEQWPLVRTLQLIAEFRSQVCDVLAGKAPVRSAPAAR